MRRDHEGGARPGLVRAGFPAGWTAGRLLPVLAALAILFSVPSASATIYTVNSTLDLPDADGTDNACATQPPGSVCTLRAAVMQANAHPGADSIAVPAGTYVLTRVGYDATASLGDLDITEDVTIFGTGGPVIIDANGAVTFDRAFEVVSGVLSLSDGITIKGGYSPSYGGAIYVQGGLHLYNVTVTGNTAFLNGGGIYATGPLVSISQSLIQGNTTQQGGGGIAVEKTGATFPELDVSDSSILDNHALGVVYQGGGISAYGANLTVSNCTFRGNSAQEGGGLSYASGYAGLTYGVSSSVFDGNSAVNNAGGLYLYGNGTITNTHVTRNSAGSAGGIYAYFGTHTLTDVEVSHNHATSDACGGIFATSGNVNMTRGWVDGNTAVTLGGGLCHGGAGAIQMTLVDTNVLNNTASDGGGVFVGKSFAAKTSAIYRNRATRGAGMFVTGTATFDNGTISGNSAGTYGGAIYADTTATVKVNSATIVNNIARTSFPSPGTGAGIYIASPASVTATGSAFSANSNSFVAASFTDCAGTMVSGGYNFLSTNAGCTLTGDSTGNQVGGTFPSTINPQLSKLQWLGNPGLGPKPPASVTPAHVPASTSPLINAGDPGGCRAADGGYFLVDQIGHSRIPRCDIGAVETGAVIPSAVFYSLTPCRLFDTRSAAGPDAASPALSPSASRVFDLSLRCGLPLSARAVSVNVSVTGPAADGYLGLYPGDEAPPLASSINFRAGQTRTNNAIVPLAGDFSHTMGVLNAAAGPVHFILDLNGYFR